MAFKPFEIPLIIQITTPSKQPQRTGIHATGHANANMLYARVNQFDYKEIERACEILGIGTSTFFRGAVTSAAHTLCVHYSRWEEQRDFHEWREKKRKEEGR